MDHGSPILEDGERKSGRYDEAHLLPAAYFDYKDGDGTVANWATRRWARRWWRLAESAVPRRLTVEPMFPSIQKLPARLLDRAVPGTKRRMAVLAVFLRLWAAAFVPLLLGSGRPAKDGYGRDVVNLDSVDRRFTWTRPDGLRCPGTFGLPLSGMAPH